ncbi:transcriptional repressor LexA [Advenella mimigardefordensis]|uniref:LexA repressor n=1 Tax=Advenella mimigardefordensis (strain DSM 17166 / LMG 22922 / DPN7) TaxID=1247726 RepID=W0PEH3_ADVMD|nr:transcriptional repressor LexA [Advenella mimigardefordensis]AHG63897.1 LexA repressor [Advenella mimigardefordensis DPN7]
MSLKLTARQQEILNLIKAAVERTGFPPTRAEIAAALGFKSPNAAEDHLRALARKGAITLTAGASRGIRLVEDADTAATGSPSGSSGSPTPGRSTSGKAAGNIGVSLADGLRQLLLPVVGKVAAGSPILATEHIHRELSIDPSLFEQQPDYLLTVKGQSMQNIGIMDGDLLAVKRSPDARNGQIVVARIDDEVTVKRFNRRGRIVELLPENDEFSPIIVSDENDFAIEGIAVGLIRPHNLH